MYGKATLDIPAVGNIGRSRTDGLSDQLAMILGRTAAWTLSEQDGYVTVTLESGAVKVIGHDTVKGKLTFGNRHHNYRTYLDMQQQQYRTTANYRTS